MTDNRLLFDRALDGEPPLGLTLEPVVAAGRRVRRRRRLAYGASALSLSALAVAAVPTLGGGDGASVRPVRPAASAAPQRQQVDPALTPQQRAIAQAIVDTSPAGWRFDFSPDRWSDGGLEGTVDDGRGEARLMVGISTKSQLFRPCQDKEFSESAPCAEKPQPDGAMLSTRTRARSAAYDIVYIHAALTNPDGSGVIVESANAALKWPLPQVTTAEEKRDLFQPVRDEPAYTEEQVGELALAIARALRELS